MLVKSKKKLYGIDPKSWQHPADTAALTALKQIRGLDELIRWFVSFTNERSLRLLCLASAVRVNERQFPRIDSLRDEILDVLDWPRKPEIFITQSPFFNAQVLGVDNPFIILNSSLVKSCDDEELESVVAHEIGHIMSGHSLYKTIVWLLAQLSLSLIPLAELAIIPIKLALSEWDRKSELSADRAGLLAMQQEEPGYRVLMRAAGGDDLSQMNIEEFFAQAAEYDRNRELIDSFHKLMNQLNLSHPLPVIRLQELKSWASSGYYSSILEGNYIRRDIKTDDLGADIKAGFDHYREKFGNSDDPIEKLAYGIGTGFEKVADDIGAKLKELFNTGATEAKTEKDGEK